MTFDEALDHLYTYSSTLGSGQTTQAQHEEAKKVAIATMRKYQKLERVLDKIRTEIMSLTNGDTPERIWNVDVLEIIDKYKEESEWRNDD